MMIKLLDIQKTYIRRNGKSVCGLKNISLSFGSTGLIFIVGKSGCGKTTLLNILGGIDVPTNGELLFNGQTMFCSQSKRIDRYRNEQIGFIFQDYNLINKYNVGKNVGLSLELQGKKPSKQLIDKYLRQLDLVDNNDETLFYANINELSGGQKQRVAIARALIKNPNMILADEPSGALDSNSSFELYKILKEISKTKLVIVVSHDLNNARLFGDRIIEIEKGMVISDCKFNNSISLDNQEAKIQDKPIKKYGLSFRNKLSIALSSIKSRPLKYVFSIITTVISCSLFCFSLVASNTDQLKSELKTCYVKGVQTAIIKSNSYCDNLTIYSDGTTKEENYECEHSLTNRQLELMDISNNSDLSRSTLTTYICENFGANCFSKELTVEEDNNPYNYLAVHGMTRVVEIDSSKDYFKNCLTPDSRITLENRLPTNNFEIAITDYWADMFIRFGYKNPLNGATCKINHPNELIGKEIDKGLKICGVFKTEEDKDFLKQYDKDTNIILDGFLDFYLGGEHPINYAFVCNDFILNGFSFSVPVDCLCILKGNLSQDLKIIETVTYSYEEDFDDGIIINKGKYNISATYQTRYSGFEDYGNFYREPITIKVFNIAAGVMSALSCLILFNFLQTSLNEQKRDYGILRALGASSFDVTTIFLLQTIIVLLLSFVLSLGLTGLFCLALNLKYDFWLFNISTIPFIGLLGLNILITLISSVAPLIELGNKKPADIIRNN